MLPVFICNAAGTLLVPSVNQASASMGDVPYSTLPGLAAVIQGSYVSSKETKHIFVSLVTGQADIKPHINIHCILQNLVPFLLRKRLGH